MRVSPLGYKFQTPDNHRNKSSPNIQYMPVEFLHTSPNPISSIESRGSCVPILLSKGSTGSISMFSRVTEPWESTGGPLTNFMELKCSNCHFCPPSGSAHFLNEITNRSVKTGMKLESEHEN